MSIVGSRLSSHAGSHQALWPSRLIAAGTSTIRTSVTSRNTATERPIPNIFVVTSTSRMNEPNTLIMMSAALVITRAVEPTPSTTARRGSECLRYSSRIRLIRNTS